MLAVIRIRGSVNVSPGIRDTLKMLRLNQVNHCVVVPKTPSLEGMLRKARSYITWGEIKPEILGRMIAKRGRAPGNKRIEGRDVKTLTKKAGKEDLEMKPVFRLSPPSRGFKSIRKPFPKGDLGPRGDKINDLLERMI